MKNETVVFIHGIWMKGFELLYLSRKIKKSGYKTYHFRYSSLFKTPVQNAERLNRFLLSINEPVIHLVAHSLGGIVVLHLLSQHKQSKLGKVIMLGTPIKGSAAAKNINQRWWLKWLLGKSRVKGLLGDIAFFSGEQEIYMIAGNKGIGMGKVLAYRAMQKESDGTVNLDETLLPYITQHTIVPYSHFTMLWSNKVAQKIIEILAK